MTPKSNEQGARESNAGDATLTVARVKRLGQSFMVPIPKRILELLNLQDGETLEVSIRRPRVSYLGALRGIGRFTEADRRNGP